jgi:hypothetical protein
MIDFGIIANVDSGAPESNHKPNAKAPSQNTQMQAESFEVQTAQCYVENLIIDFAWDALHADHGPITKGSPVSTDVLRDAWFTFKINKGCKGELNVVSFQWTSKSISQPYQQQYTDWLTRHISSKLTQGTRIWCCTEHKRHEQFLYRAHPAYRGHIQGQDWAIIDWSGDSNKESNKRVFIPGQIVLSPWKILYLTPEYARS